MKDMHDTGLIFFENIGKCFHNFPVFCVNGICDDFDSKTLSFKENLGWSLQG
jgi:hypothetical protein